MNGERLNRILWLDFLRAFAMLYIVAIHPVDDYGNQLFQSNFDDIFTYALLGMFVFLSGYLLTKANRIRTGSDIKKFLKKRLLRIYPLYVMSLLLFFCFFPERLPTALLFQHLILYNMISGDSVFTLWFVTMICLFYLLFPVLIYNYSVKRVIVVSAVLFVLLLLGHNFFEIFDKRLFIYLPLFTFGLLVAKQDAIHALLKKKVLLASLILAGGE